MKKPYTMIQISTDKVNSDSHAKLCGYILQMVLIITRIT